MKCLKALKVLLIVSTLSVVAGCGKTDIPKETEAKPVVDTTPQTSAYITDVVEEFEENGEKFYREITATAKMEIIYRKFDKKIISKEEVIGYEPVSIAKGQALFGQSTSGSKNLRELTLYNIYDDESIKNVELTLYNCSAYFSGGERQDFQKLSNVYRFCDSYTANLSERSMANVIMLFDFYGKQVDEYKIMANIIDKSVIQADITYIDGTTKTEYLSLGSYEGRNCNYLTLYRLEVEE